MHRLECDLSFIDKPLASDIHEASCTFDGMPADPISTDIRIDAPHVLSLCDASGMQCTTSPGQSAIVNVYRSQKTIDAVQERKAMVDEMVPNPIAAIDFFGLLRSIGLIQDKIPSGKKIDGTIKVTVPHEMTTFNKVSRSKIVATFDDDAVQCLIQPVRFVRDDAGNLITKSVLDVAGLVFPGKSFFSLSGVIPSTSAGYEPGIRCLVPGPVPRPVS